MNSLSLCLLAMSLILATYFINSTSAAPKKCVFICLKGVIKCKRDLNIPGRLPPGTDCCENYTACNLACNPTATSFPPCTMKGKRGSWNKRMMASNQINSPALRPSYLADGGSNRGYSPDSFDNLLDQFGDMD